MKAKTIIVCSIILILSCMLVACKQEIPGGDENLPQMKDVVPEEILVPGSGDSGVFIQGRNVTLSGYEISQYEVTQKLFQHVMGFNPSGSLHDQKPVENVTWYDAVYFCNELTKQEMTAADCVYTITSVEKDGNTIISAEVTQDSDKKGYRLPTEAEWEFAARGGNPIAPAWSFDYSGSNTIGDVAWYEGNASTTTHEVGKKNANSLDLYDMSGNVHEWCWDLYSDVITTGNATDPTGPSEGSNRVGRGGYYTGEADWAKVTFRSSEGPDNGGHNIGFRVCRTK